MGEAAKSMKFPRAGQLIRNNNPICGMPKPFVPDYERKTIPFLPMMAISFVSFLDNFCYTLVTPIIPYMCKIYYPDVFYV